MDGVQQYRSLWHVPFQRQEIMAACAARSAEAAAKGASWQQTVDQLNELIAARREQPREQRFRDPTIGTQAYYEDSPADLERERNHALRQVQHYTTVMEEFQRFARLLERKEGAMLSLTIDDMTYFGL